MSTSDGSVHVCPSYQEYQVPETTVHPAPFTTGVVDSAMRTSCRVSQPLPSASIQCWKRLRSYPTLTGVAVTSWARASEAVRPPVAAAAGLATSTGSKRAGARRAAREWRMESYRNGSGIELISVVAEGVGLLYEGCTPLSGHPG